MVQNQFKSIKSNIVPYQSPTKTYNIEREKSNQHLQLIVSV